MPLKPSLPSVRDVLEELGSALSQFGEYAFFDKGPREVLELDSLVRRVEAAEPAAAAKFLRSLALSWSNLPDGSVETAPARVASAIVLELQEWDALFDQPGIDELLNNDRPELQAGDAPVAAIAQFAKSESAKLARSKAKRARP